MKAYFNTFLTICLRKYDEMIRFEIFSTKFDFES